MNAEIIRCWETNNPLLIEYHDREWGVPVHDDRKLFEKLSLDIFQAGLNWELVLNKRESFRKAFDNFEYKDAKVKINNGDTILLFSDGLAELFNDKKEMYDYDRIKSTFENIGHKSSQLIIDDLVEEVDKWRNGNSPNDDVTLVVLKVINSN